MNIIGINAWHADASAALVVNGALIVAIEEERFTRKKHWAGFPGQAIEFCMREAGLSWEDIDFFAIGRDPKAKMGKKLMYLAQHPAGSMHAVRGRLQNRRQVASVAEELAVLSGLPAGVFKYKVRNVEHHRSHLASAFYASPYQEAACLSVDGSGDFTTTMMAMASDNRIEILNSIDFPHSLGIFYTAFTQLLGFPHYGDEYKVMGMAPYGRPIYKDRIADIISHQHDGTFRLDLSFFRKGTAGIISYDEDFIPVVAPLFSSKLADVFGPPRNPSEPLSQHHKDLAASVQSVTEDTLFFMMEHLYKKTGCANLCLAGGVAQNSVANGKISLRTPFKNVYIPSAGHDAGISMGCALYTAFNEGRVPPRTPVYSAFLGSRFSNEEISKFLQQQDISHEVLEDDALYDSVTESLIAGGVVGWFAGRAEFGPRALGGRSILADPRRKDARDIINSKIKRRESFRPFAPSIMREHTAAYFEQSHGAVFMEKVFQVREEKRSSIPAVTHVDGSGRLQTVEESIAPRYYRLISTFFEKTGVPILLNTSFNENEPIVNTPAEAVDCFMRTDMDMLVMENVVLTKENQ